MNLKEMFWLGALVISCASIPLSADELPNDARQFRDTDQPHNLQRMPALARAAKANQILGKEIKDADGQRVGKVRDLAIDLQNGRIVEVIVGFGGFLGIGEKDTAIPPVDFSYNKNTKVLRFELDKEQLRFAPKFDLSRWSEETLPESIREVYRRYNVTPYFIDESVHQPAPTEVKPAAKLTARGLTAPTAHLGIVQRARKVMGLPVQNPERENLGRVENMIVDVPAGRIVEIIMSTSEIPGMRDEDSEIPPQAFHQEADQKKLLLDTTPEALSNAPNFNARDWPDLADSSRVTKVYAAYHIPPYQGGFDVDNTALNVRDRSSDTLTPMDQGASASDRAITTNIRRSIMARQGLSTEARNVKIITRNGQVTLRGPVRNEAEEQIIIDIAKDAVARNAKITDEIDSPGTATTPKKVGKNNLGTPGESNQ